MILVGLTIGHRLSSPCLAGASPPPFTVDELKKIAAGGNSGKKLSSIEELLASLPADLRSHSVFVTKSGSLQTATPKDPRVILHSTDAKFLMAFNGKGTRTDELEIIQFDEPSAKFNFFRADFKSGSFQVHQPEGNECKRCHGQDPRPNWSAYPDWPGTFGSNDMAIDVPETRQIEKFIRTATSHPRYRHLPGLSDRLRSNPDGEGNAFGGNSNLTENVAHQNFKRVRRLVRNTPDYDLFKYAILGALRCPDLKFQEFLPVASPARNLTFGSFGETGESGAVNNPFFWIFQHRQISTTSWSMMFLDRKSANATFQNPMTTPENAGAELGWILAQGDPELLAYFESGKLYIPSEKCDQLKVKSRTELSRGLVASVADKPGDATTPQAGMSGDGTPGKSLLERRCFACHDGPDKTGVSFREDDLKALLNRVPTFGETLIRRTLLTEPEVTRMPLHSAPLNESERRQIRIYLRDLGERAGEALTR